MRQKHPCVLCLILVSLLMFAGCSSVPAANVGSPTPATPATAEPSEQPSTSLSSYLLEENLTYQEDMDCDGLPDTLLVSHHDQEAWDTLYLDVQFGDGNSDSFEIGEGIYASVWLASDGKTTGLLASVDYASCDYETRAFVFSGQSLTQTDKLFGVAAEVDDANRTVCIQTTVEALGTHSVYMNYSLTDSFTLQPSDNGLWYISNPQVVYTSREVPVMLLAEDGSFLSSVLDADVSVKPVATDCSTSILFVLQDGTRGYIPVSYEEALPSIAGEFETEWFQNLFYAG